ncbi:MAG: hypothetical protein ICV64_12300 [Thermoleophilia bacterium]|nr:hypothetical protein [Thermoleophilia bacterium]
MELTSGPKTKALEGVLERVQGRQASRLQASLAAAGAAVAVYRLLRSGSSDDSREESKSEADGQEADEQSARAEQDA